MTNAEHYHRVYDRVRAQGFHEPISLAPSWQSRADALYAQVSSTSVEGVRYLWPGPIGLLTDGRMACVAVTRDAEGNEIQLFGVVEAKAA